MTAHAAAAGNEIVFIATTTSVVDQPTDNSRLSMTGGETVFFS